MFSIFDNKNVTHVSILLDASGSMAGKVKDTIGGVNSYISKLREDKKSKYVVNMYLFDTTRFNALAENEELKNVKEVTTKTYETFGATPLYDSVGKMIKMANDYEANKHIVVIMTDGEENSSREMSLRNIKDLIQRKKADDWEFLFLGADFNNYSQGYQWGLSKGDIMSYGRGIQASASAFDSVARRTLNYSAGVADTFTSADKIGAGDKFDKNEDDIKISKISITFPESN